ncbi:MKI67 FHA domain-interacting nucleolar phosphoprotein-like [Glossina fuscipes]|uniref:MKI67 FHA domain-interacting nucleolar phosphoprotein-like n=1 Tax=Glossina fuscipes TaxID=7396 RepID=A0A9C5Z0G2_9MUSC|nr:MKI67 FHA domain-interacting nucleolar phosphoprotein-like [Glossina fuscipes]
MPPYKRNKPPKIPEPSQESSRNSAEDKVVSGQLEKKIKKQKRASKPIKNRGVVFIKHLPHGFFEEQMRHYFSQFGDVTRLRLVRSKRTGGSKGYAFVEFRHPEVAQVAAETMNNYLMFQKVLKAAYIPPDEQKYNYFRSTVRQVKTKSGKMKWVSSTTASIQRKTQQYNDWSQKNLEKRTAKQIQKLKSLNKKFSHLGIDFSQIAIPPNEAKEDVENGNEIEEDNNKSEEKKSLKRKVPKASVSSSEDQKKKKLKSKKDINLEDLLAKDSSSESFAASAADLEQLERDCSEDNESVKSLDGDHDSTKSTNEESADSNNENNDEELEKVKPKVKLNFGKSLKATNIERFDQVLKRKPHTGGIKKNGKKPKKATLAIADKNSQQKIDAIKKLAKPLSQIKTKNVKNNRKQLKVIK